MGRSRTRTCVRMSCMRYCAGLGCRARWSCDYGLLVPGARCPICAASRSAHAYAFDPQSARASSSGACPLCLPPGRERRKRDRGQGGTDRRRRGLVLSDHSHAVSAFVGAPTQAWDVPLRGDLRASERAWTCPLCLHAWGEPLGLVLKRAARCVNVCSACREQVRWADVADFAGGPPLGTGPWGALRWLASPFVHPDSIYAHLHPSTPARGLDTETIEQRLGRVCPSALLRPPRWLRRTCASRAERIVRVWLEVIVAPWAQVYSEVTTRVDCGRLCARFDFGYVCKADRSVRLIEIDGDQHFNDQAFGHAIGGARRIRRGHNRDRLKDSFVASSSKLYMLRMSTTFVHGQGDDARKALALWCRPGGHADRKIICLGQEYARSAPPPSPQPPTPSRVRAVRVKRVGAQRARDDSDIAIARTAAGDRELNHRRRSRSS